MTHAPHQTEHDSDIDAFIESIDPDSMRDAQYLRSIAAARDGVEEAERNLIDAIRAARSAGDSWTAIGMALRTSKQNAHRKFANLVDLADDDIPAAFTRTSHSLGPLSDVVDISSVTGDLGNRILHAATDTNSTNERTEEVNMTNNSRHVVPSNGGGWDVVKPNSERVSSHHDTQSDAIGRGREIIRNAGGGELNIHGRDGAIRAKDTIPNGNDPRSSKG